MMALPRAAVAPLESRFPLTAPAKVAEEDALEVNELEDASACWAVDLSWAVSFWMEVMPWDAAWMVWIPFEMPSSSVLSADERELSEDAVKKFDALSMAELTFLPVDKRCCVVATRSAVSCSESRLDRVAEERVTPEDMR